VSKINTLDKGDIMPRPSFNNVGLRRDLNLSDLENREQALDNLLNNLVTTDDGSTFDRNDLLDAIKDISNTNVTQRSIALMAGLTVKNTVVDPNTGLLVDKVAEPLITVKNQIDSILATTNDPPFFNGGDGLTARFYDTDAITDFSSLNINSKGSAVVSGSPVVTKTYWTNGLFEFSNKLDDALNGGNGAVQWTGWYTPDSSGPSTFSISTTGYIIVEFENEFGDLEIKRNIYKPQRTVYTNAIDLEGDNVRVPIQQGQTIANGDKLIAVNDANRDPIPLPTDRDITVVSAGTTNITLSESINETGIGEDWEFIFDNSDLIGAESYSFSIVLPELEKYVPVQMRITYWYPGDEVEYFNKVLDVNLTTQLKSSGDLPYWYLYTVIGDQEEDQGFKGFYDKRLLLGGGTIGPETALVSSQYNKWLSLKPLILAYDPPRTFNDALRGEYRYSTTTSSNVIGTSTISPYTDNLEVGNIVITPVVPDGAFITDISRNNIIIISELATEDVAADIQFMDHRGYLGNTFASSNGTQVTIPDTTGLLPGTVVIAEGVEEGDYVRVQKILNSRQFTTNRALNLTPNQQIYFYSDKGLANRAYDNFCAGTAGAEIEVTATNGDTYLILNSLEGITNGMVVQSSPFIPFDVSDPDNPIITFVDGIEPTQDNLVELDQTSLVGGSGYTPASGTATYVDVPLTGGSGTNAFADITVTDGAVSAVSLTLRGSGYTAGDSLSADAINIGGTVTTAFSIENSGIIPNSITISRAVAHPDNKDMVAGITLVFCPDTTTQNKEVCVVPLNTAPPFVGTIDGLRTTDGTGGTKDLNLAGPDAVLNVLNLRAENVGSIVELGEEPAKAFDRKIPITCAGTAFTILATTNNSPTS